MSRLSEFYTDTVTKNLIQKFNYKNVMEVPSIEKIILNMGVGEAAQDSKKIKAAFDDMTRIAGQKPLETKAKKSEAGFKIRQGMSIGVKVTLRKARMYEFLDRLVNIALPRVKDFRGLSPKSFDGRGNYAFGIKEQIIFQEIDYDKIDTIRGLDVIIVTTAKTDDEARELLREFNLPFKKMKG